MIVFSYLFSCQRAFVICDFGFPFSFSFPFSLIDFVKRCRRPEAHRAVGSATSHKVSVWGKRRRVAHRAQMSSERERHLAGRHVPKFDRPVAFSRGEGLAIRRKRQAQNPRRGLRYRMERTLRSYVVKDDDAIIAASGQPRIIGTESHRPNSI